MALIAGAAAVIAALVFLLQLPSLSIQKLMHGDGIVTSSRFWILEALASSVSSFIISAISVLLFRRLVVWIGVTSVVMQIAWMVFTLSFSSPINTIEEAAFRSAEPLGIVVGAAFAVLLVRRLFPAKENSHP